ncbi:MAG: hypothetical protein KAW09_02610, partial [Thermoplasmata archaeon]|nr:hypothetical protein [Thermoplasmata archaeon]
MVVDESLAVLEGKDGHRTIKEPGKGLRSITLGVFFSKIPMAFLFILLGVSITNQEVEAATWGSEQEISVDVASENQAFPSIAVEGDEVHVVWEYGANESDIYYRKFDGTSWLAIQEISTDVPGEEQLKPSIAAASGKVHVVWRECEWDYNIYYRQFDGTTWLPEEDLTKAKFPEHQLHPSIAVDGDSVHVVWENHEDIGPWGDIYYKRFNGFSWDPILEISTDITDEGQDNPSVAAEGGTVHVVWEDWRDGDLDIYYRCFNGTDWGPVVEISKDVGTERQGSPSIAVDNGKVHVVWGEEGSDGDIYYRQYNGTDWEPIVEISGTLSHSSPSIAADNGTIHVVWHDAKGSGDIYYRSFNGTVWQPEQKVNTDISGTTFQHFPSIASDAGKVHVVWEDWGDGDRDIFYRSGIEDFEGPQSKAYAISPYWQTASAFDIGWDATDNSDLANVSLHFRYSADNSSWSNWDVWDYDNSVSGTYSSGTFIFVPPNGDGFYEFYTVATDTSCNFETTPSGPDASVGFDTTHPTGSIFINTNDEWTTSTSVTLFLGHTDTTSGVQEVRFSNDGFWDTEAWEPPMSTKIWSILNGDGTKIVFFQIRDYAGLES